MIDVARLAHLGGIIIAAVALLAAAPKDAARGEPAMVPLPKSAPLRPPAYDPDLFKIPYAASIFDLDLERFRKDIPEMTFSDRVDLGDYKLRFDTARAVAEAYTRAEIDQPSAVELIPQRSGKKRSRRMMDYFGLTLTAPTN